MIRVDLDEQTAADLHGLLERMQPVLDQDREDLIAPIRNTKLALAGALRAAGWTPAPAGWEKRALSGGGRR